MKKHQWHVFWHEKLFEKHPQHTTKHALKARKGPLLFLSGSCLTKLFKFFKSTSYWFN
jgi:hypothetical protein